jgi:hypothetical protein
MRDIRALANPRNLESYRAWGREGLRRSGYLTILLVFTMLSPMLPLAITLSKPVTRDAHAWSIQVGAASALYLMAVLGLMLFAVLRLNAWKRAHPWTPPPSRAWK